MIKQFGFDTPGQGLHDITAQVASVVRTACDLERWLNRLVPDLSIPVMGGDLCLGTWQGIYLWEHRRRGSRRELVVHVGA